MRVFEVCRNLETVLHTSEKGVVMRSTDEVMYILYRRRGWNQRDVALLYGCDISTVCRHLNAEAERRGEVFIGLPAGALWEGADEGRIVKNRALLVELYIKRQKSIQEISDMLMCSKFTVESRLKKYNIRIRPPGNPMSDKKIITGHSDK
jgi:hypothetical protein